MRYGCCILSADFLENAGEIFKTQFFRKSAFNSSAFEKSRKLRHFRTIFQMRRSGYSVEVRTERDCILPADVYDTADMAEHAFKRFPFSEKVFAEINADDTAAVGDFFYLSVGKVALTAVD